jgi:methionyl-tRNA formyltransferase
VNPVAAPTAVVFAYHSVGVRCLQVLLNHGVHIPLVISHQDQSGENIWFDSVAQFAHEHHLPLITPDSPNTPSLQNTLKALNPDFIFSFYYRHMICPEILAIPAQGAYNLHGSLLPKYRGRVPVNWAVIHGEKETGATLHAMTAKPDQGDIFAQEAVAIGPNETAHEVFLKVVTASETALNRVLPKLLAGTAKGRRQKLKSGSYFGGRKPEDGRIHWNQSAAAIHNLVRGVAPPYPGAFTTLHGKTARILKTSLEPRPDAVAVTQGGDGAPLYLLEVEWDGKRLLAPEFKQNFPRGVRPEG